MVQMITFNRIKRLNVLFSYRKAKHPISLASLQSNDKAAIMSKRRSIMHNHSEQPMPQPKDYLVWIDMEMTGLDVSRDSILEVACLITDPSLTIIGEGPDIIIHQPDNVLQSMNAWSLEHHAKSGLTEASRQSNITLQAAEQEIVSFLRNHIPPGKCPLAGNSVYMDRLFLIKYMPQVDKYLHYRIVDVSTVKELCKRWKPETLKKAPQKVLAHRALDDIKESIAELKYYKSTFFDI